MQKEMYMPVRCVRCETLFDLSYDLDKEDDFVSKHQMKNLCWECRFEE